MLPYKNGNQALSMYVRSLYQMCLDMSLGSYWAVDVYLLIIKEIPNYYVTVTVTDRKM